MIITRIMALPSKVKYSIAGMFIFPCFARLVLHGTGHEHAWYRYLIPLFVGASAGFLTGLMKDRWSALREKLQFLVQEKTKDLSREVMRRGRAEGKLQRLNTFLLATRNINQLIVRERDREKLIQGACECLAGARNFQQIWIVLSDERGDVVSFAGAGMKGDVALMEKAVGNGDSLYCIRSAMENPGVTLVNEPSERCKSCPMQARGACGKAIAVRIEYKGKTYGVMTASGPESIIEDEEELSLFCELASDLGFALYGIEAEEKERAIRQALQESEERFRAFIGATTFEGIILNREGVIADINDQFAKMYGYEREELIGMKALDTIAPESRDYVRKMIQERHEEPYEAVALRKDGSTFPIEVHARTINYRGKTVRAAAIRDMTERKLVEESLKQEEEKFRVLVEKAPFGISLVRKDGRYTYVNPKFVETFGYRLEDIPTGRDWFEKAFPDEGYRKKVVSTWLNDLKRFEIGQVRQQTFDVTCSDGSQKKILFRSVTLAGGHQFIIYEDITEKENLERQYQHAQKMEAVGTLAGGIAHDFNNLLQAILGYTQILLLDREEKDAAYARLKEIEKSARRASELTQQILTFSRKVESVRRPMDLNQEVRQVVKLLKRTIPKMIEIELFFEKDLGIINADPAQVEQIIMNIAVNARDAMPEGGKLLIETENIVLDEEYCKTHLGASPGKYALLRISDTGSGMDKETLEHIFEPFFTTKDIGRGTGLGLAMVYGIVKEHGGYIMCYSEPGTGTEFKVYFPVIEQEEPFRMGDDRDGGPDSIPGGTEVVLLVDDEQSILDTAKEMLGRFGYRVITAGSGEDAIHTVKRAVTGDKDTPFPDIVILDLSMPGMGGHACLERLLEMHPDMKIVIASGYSVNGAANNTLKAGAKGFISKPYRLEEMLRKVRR
ncbi:MAG: PAS domain S-box protein, partial [Deltaproteobacteria bacterium]|nr:PAS domain S-box protein [Deltaproteobacteria bacterium]